MTAVIQQWFHSKIEGFSFSGAAARTGIPVSSVRRHLTDADKTQGAHGTAVAVCRAYDLPVIEGLIQSGLVTGDEASEFTARKSLQQFSTRELLLEVLHRTGSEKASGSLRSHS